MLRSRFCFCLFCAVVGAALALLLFSTTNRAEARQPASEKPGAVSFINDIAPIFKESCFGCHGAKSPKGKFDMTKFDSLLRGGTKDNIVVAGKHDESYLVDVLEASGKKRMPPIDSGEALPKDKIELIKRWIKEGGKLDAGLKGDADLLRELRYRWKPPALLTSYPYPVTITALAFTNDNKKLVVGGHHELTVWDPTQGKLEKRIRTRARRAMAMTFMKDGKLIVAGGRPGEEGDVRVYNLAAPGKTADGVAVLDGVESREVMVKQLLDADDEVLAVALSGDETKLASGGTDRMVNVWDLSGGLEKATAAVPIENHADWVFGAAFSPDGKTLYTSSRDKTAKVWDLAGKESVLTFQDHQNTVYGVMAKPDGKAGYSAGEDGQLRMWSNSGDKAGKQIKASPAHAKGALKVIFAGKGTLATCGVDGTVKLWNAETLAAVKTLGGFTDHVYAVAVSPDGSLVAGGAFNGEVRVFKASDGALVKSFNASVGLKVEPPKK